MHYLSIAAIFKQENPWLVEWLDYHLARGVEHFYLYNNDDDTTESDGILEPYVTRGLIDNIHAPGLAMQMPCMAEAITAFQNDTYWLACVDLDEFILPRQCDDIRNILQDYEFYSGLCINWCLFGSNNHIKRPPNQIDHFLRRAADSHHLNAHVKSIVRPCFVDTTRQETPHFFPSRAARQRRLQFPAPERRRRQMGFQRRGVDRQGGHGADRDQAVFR